MTALLFFVRLMKGLDRLVVYGRTSSSNVMKVLWTLSELEVSYSLVPAGLDNTLNKANPAFREISPTGLVPAIEFDRDARHKERLDESNTITRFLCDVSEGGDRLLPRAGDALRRARINRWLDYSIGTIEPAMRPVFFHEVRGEKCSDLHAAVEKAASVWSLVESTLKVYQKSHLVKDGGFSLADITIGPQLHRFMRLEAFQSTRQQRDFSALYRLYAEMERHEGFVTHVQGVSLDPM